jgi:hypothetical protein
LSTSLLGLRAAVNAMLPRVDLPEVLLEMFSPTALIRRSPPSPAVGPVWRTARDDRRAASRG